jgi:hypothetical protein
MNHAKRVGRIGGLGIGAALAVVSLPIAVAAADEEYWVPDPYTFDPAQLSGSPPYSPLVATGTEDWSLFDGTTQSILVPDQIPNGVDTVTMFGSFTNDLFSSGSQGDLFDFANFGGGWANEWIDFPSASTPVDVSDLLITPFGDFEILGTFLF